MARTGLVVVTRPGQGLGFRLAGVPVAEVEEAEVAERFRALLGDGRVGVLAVQEGLLAAVPEPLLTRAGREGLPVILPFALPTQWKETGGGEQYVATLVRRAIGYHVKIQR